MDKRKPTYLAPRDVGRLLGITTSGVIALVERGQLEDIRDSAGRRFFDPVEVQRLITARAAAKNDRRGRKAAANHD